MSLMLTSMLFFAVAMMSILGVAIVLGDSDYTAGFFLAVGVAFFLFFAMWSRRHYRRLKADVRGGVKEAVQGALEDKVRHRANCEFTIDGKKYHVDIDAYYEYDKGDQVLISYGPASRVMLQMEKIDRKD